MKKSLDLSHHQRNQMLDLMDSLCADTPNQTSGLPFLKDRQITYLLGHVQFDKAHFLCRCGLAV